MALKRALVGDEPTPVVSGDKCSKCGQVVVGDWLKTAGWAFASKCESCWDSGFEEFKNSCGTGVKRGNSKYGTSPFKVDQRVVIAPNTGTSYDGETATIVSAADGKGFHKVSVHSLKNVPIQKVHFTDLWEKS